jgi:hypothetical protein
MMENIMQTEKIKMPLGATEASGVTRKGNELLIVSDAAPGTYFSFDVSNSSGPLIRFLPDKVRAHELSGASLAPDFESVDVLADDRIVALSERLRSLIGTSGLVLQYDDPLSELGERGLEGLAVRSSGNGASEVAVLWEGGWIEDGDVQPQIRKRLGEPLLPVIFIHTIERGEAGMKVKVTDDRELVELNVPQPDNDKDGWRFRAPDLVWHRWHLESGENTLGFIVLLNSQTARKLPGKSKFGPCWLQRFDRSGNPFGAPIDLGEQAQKLLGDDRLRGANWEGLGWYEIGQRLVLVHDEPNLIDGIPIALVVDLPSSWL